MTSAPVTRPSIKSRLFNDLILERRVGNKSMRDTVNDSVNTDHSARESRRKQEASNHFNAAAKRRRSSSSYHQSHIAKTNHSTITLLDNLIMAPVSLTWEGLRLMNLADTKRTSHLNSKKHKPRETNAVFGGSLLKFGGGQKIGVGKVPKKSKDMAAASKQKKTVHRAQSQVKQSRRLDANRSRTEVGDIRDSVGEHKSGRPTPMSGPDHTDIGRTIFNPIIFDEEEPAPSAPGTIKHRTTRGLTVEKVEAPGTDSEYQTLHDDDQRRIIEQHQAQLEALNKIIVEKQRTIDEQYERIQQYEKNTRDQQDRVQGQQHDIDSQQQSIEKLQECQASQRGTIDKLNDELRSYHSTIENNDKKISELDNRVTELQIELDQARQHQSDTLPINSTLANTPGFITPQASPPIESLHTEEDKKVENIRKTYVRLQARFHRLQKAATDIVSCTRSMDTSTFGEFGRCLDRLHASVEHDYAERHSALAAAQGVSDVKDGGSVDWRSAAGDISPL